MKKTLLVFTASLLALGMGTSCRKDIQEIDKDFVGSWTTRDYEKRITIEFDGRGSYSSSEGFFLSRDVEGPALIHINGDILRISNRIINKFPASFMIYKRLKINQRPTLDGHSKMMILESDTFKTDWY